MKRRHPRAGRLNSVSMTGLDGAIAPGILCIFQNVEMTHFERLLGVGRSSL